MFNLAIDAITAKPYTQRNFHFNEFVANALRDNIGSKNLNLTSEKKDEALS